MFCHSHTTTTTTKNHKTFFHGYELNFKMHLYTVYVAYLYDKCCSCKKIQKQQNKYMIFFVSLFHKVFFLCVCWYRTHSLVKTSHKTKHYYYNLETSSSICDSERFFVVLLRFLLLCLWCCSKRWQQKSNKIFLMWYKKKIRRGL